jgi:hypothetical protein
VAAGLSGGQDVGGCHILAVAGSGGMGTVYRAEQLSLGRVVALKVIRPEISGTGDYRLRFMREAHLAAAVSHPHVVSVYDVGEDASCLYLVMQWVDGTDLRALLDGQDRLTPDRAVRLGAQLARALGAVHQAGLVHRDVKPSNVLVGDIDGQDHAYLTDFGIAKMPAVRDDLTRTGWAPGTSGYLSPEQVQGLQAGPRSDLYALGCILFEALTGQRAFGGENELAVRWAHAHSPRPVASASCPALGPRYDAFLARALAIDPQDRYPSGPEFASALLLTHDGQPSTGSPLARHADAPTEIRDHPPRPAPAAPLAQTQARARGAGPDEPTALRAPRHQGAPVPDPVGTLTGTALPQAGATGSARPGGRTARLALLVACMVFLASVTLFSNYVNNGTGGKSLLQATSNDPASPLFPIDFWTVVVLAVAVLAVTVISFRVYRRLLMAVAAAASLVLTGYTLHIPFEGSFPGFGTYGPSYWLSLSVAIVMVIAAGIAAFARSGG